MDIQKFLFLQTNGREPELVSVCSDLLMDIKNVLNSIVGHTSEIGANLPIWLLPDAKTSIHTDVQCIQGLCETYFTLCQQRKALNTRIAELRALKLTNLAA